MSVVVCSFAWPATLAPSPTRQRDPLVKRETVEGIGSTDFRVSGSGSEPSDRMAALLLDPYRRIPL
jgi:hypothetical protein